MQLVYSDASDVGVNVGVVLFTYAKIYFVRLLKGKLVLGLTYCIKISIVEEITSKTTFCCPIFIWKREKKGQHPWIKVSFTYNAVCNGQKKIKSFGQKNKSVRKLFPTYFFKKLYILSLIPGTIHSNAWFIHEKWPRFRPGLFHHFPIDL